ncbi:MAG: hypothetical protein V4690_00705 [Patescibacteria group bacterium]
MSPKFKTILSTVLLLAIIPVWFWSLLMAMLTDGRVCYGSDVCWYSVYFSLYILPLTPIAYVTYLITKKDIYFYIILSLFGFACLAFLLMTL